MGAGERLSLAKGKGVGREGESEGSRRQMHGSRNTNRIRYRIVGLHHHGSRYMLVSRQG